MQDRTVPRIFTEPESAKWLVFGRFYRLIDGCDRAFSTQTLKQRSLLENIANETLALPLHYNKALLSITFCLPSRQDLFTNFVVSEANVYGEDSPTTNLLNPLLDDSGLQTAGCF